MLSNNFIKKSCVFLWYRHRQRNKTVYWRASLLKTNLWGQECKHCNYSFGKIVILWGICLLYCFIAFFLEWNRDFHSCTAEIIGSHDFLKRATSYTSILLSEHPFIGCAQCSVGHPAGWPVKGAAGPGSAATAPARAILRAGEDREVATDALPHAHQPGDARVRLPCVRHVDRGSFSPQNKPNKGLKYCKTIMLCIKCSVSTSRSKIRHLGGRKRFLFS